MPKIQYTSMDFSPWKLDLINKVNAIISQYAKMGYTALSLRQIYYRLVAANTLPDRWVDPATGSKNNERSYKKLGELIVDGRMAGLIDWSALEDRTRDLDELLHFANPADRIRIAADNYRLDLWTTQECRVEIWVEKDAVEGIVRPICRSLDIPLFSCRGYTSASSIWASAMRLTKHARHGQRPVILHLGDHDPSGINMSKDIEDRLKSFMGGYDDSLEFERLALNMDQIEELNPPENPAKVTDSRYAAYVNQYGESCWELDALDPPYMDNLIRTAVQSRMDAGAFNKRLAQQERETKLLTKASDQWADIVEFLSKK